MKVEKWGDDVANRSPAEIVELLDLKEGDEVDIRVSGPDTFDIEKYEGCSGRSVRVACRVHRRHPGAARG
jgi:antitoxin component of MazEF toxin-antitoxin module